MLTITESANRYLCAVLDRAHAAPETGIRLLLEGDALTPSLDTPRAGDATFEHDGRKVLVLDTRACEFLDDSTLDVQTTGEGPRLVILH